MSSEGDRDSRSSSESRLSPDWGEAHEAHEAQLAMGCELAEVLISRRVDGELDAAGLVLLEAHLEKCGDCRVRCENWTRQADALSAELGSLWSGTEVSRKPPATATDEVAAFRKLHTSARPRRFWQSAGIASQVAALIALCVYAVFFGQAAQAPDAAARENLREATQPIVSAPHEMAHGSQARPAEENSVAADSAAAEKAVVAEYKPQSLVPFAPSLPSVVNNNRFSPAQEKPSHAANQDSQAKATQRTDVAAEIKIPFTVPTLPTAPAAANAGSSAAAPTSRERQDAPAAAAEFGAAGLREMETPQLVAGLWLDYSFPATNAGEAGEYGRVLILGDTLSGRAVLRLLDSRGRVREIAQADLDTLVQEPLRGTIHRFLEVCRRSAK